MSVDAVIVNWKDNARTIMCANTLLSDPDIEQVFIVDNEANSACLINAPDDIRVTVLSVPENRGFAGGVNVAIDFRRNARRAGPVLFVNNDLSLPRGSTGVLLAELNADPGLGLVGPKLVNPDGTIQALGHRISRITGLSRPNAIEGDRVDYITWACVLIRGELLEAIGGLDERFFMYWEDVDFTLQARKIGYSHKVSNEVFAVHELSASAENAGSKLREYYAWSLRAFSIKYGRLAKFRSAIAITFLMIARVLSRDPDGVLSLIRGWRRPIQCTAYKSLTRAG